MAKKTVKRLTRKEVLQKYAEQMWKVFVTDDKWLVESTCSCCKDRRKLVAKITKELAR